MIVQFARKVFRFGVVPSMDRVVDRGTDSGPVVELSSEEYLQLHDAIDAVKSAEDAFFVVLQQIGERHKVLIDDPNAFHDAYFNGDGEVIIPLKDKPTRNTKGNWDTTRQDKDLVWY